MITGSIIFIVAVLLFIIAIRAYRKTLNVNNEVREDRIEKILEARVAFYEHLKGDEKKSFLKRVHLFLEKIKITPVNGAEVTEEDKVLVAAAGVIPLFRYKNWFYNNLNEVLLYPEPFNKQFEQEGPDRNIIGMIGDGAMHRSMILSLPYLRMGFDRESHSNTAIHEFVHLLDKSDGATDGIPDLILNDNNVKPWIRVMHEYIQYLRENNSDISAYGATNEAEFFAVVSEYFFQQPEKLRERHPALFAMLNEAFENKHEKE